MSNRNFGASAATERVPVTNAIKLVQDNDHYGNTGCGVFKRGIQN